MIKFNNYECEVSYLIIQSELEMINRTFETEFDCMNFFFSFYGTGYNWKDGEIVYGEIENDVISGHYKLKEAVDFTLSNLTLDKYNELKNRFKFGITESTLLKGLFYVYPITIGYSLMTLIPDEIEKCWFDAIGQFHKVLNDNLDKLSKKDIEGLRYSETLLSKTKIKTC